MRGVYGRSFVPNLPDYYNNEIYKLNENQILSNAGRSFNNYQASKILSSGQTCGKITNGCPSSTKKANFYSQGYV